MARKRERWSVDQIKDFRKWHEERLKELNYPEEVVKELRRAREKWMPAAKDE
jgi:intergrase/recombinase